MKNYQNTAARRMPGDNRRQIRSMVQTAIFGAIIVIMAFTPFLGYIPLGFTRATIIHIPVILASLLLGTVTSFVFTPFYNLGEFSGGIGSIIICFVPRILVGVVPYFVYKGVKKFGTGKGVSNLGLILAGISGALVNTLLVMNMIFLFFREAYAAANEVAVQAVYGFILSVIGINGVPEAIVAGILTFFIGRVLMKKSIRERLGFTYDFSD